MFSDRCIKEPFPRVVEELWKLNGIAIFLAILVCRLVLVEEMPTPKRHSGPLPGQDVNDERLCIWFIGAGKIPGKLDTASTPNIVAWVKMISQGHTRV